MSNKINNFMAKKIISLALLGATTSLMAMYGEHAYLYKDPRIMGMGGANVAVGGYSTSVYSNPAGLAMMKKDHGFIVDMLGVGLSGSGSFQKLAVEIMDAQDSGDYLDVVPFVEDYAGENFHLDTTLGISIAKNSDAFAWSVGTLAAVDINLVTHVNGTTDGSILGTSSRGYGGVVAGVAKPYNTEVGRVDIGFGLKFIRQMSYEGTLGLGDLTTAQDDPDSLQDKFESAASGFGVDIGVVYHPLPDNFLHPKFGLSVLNMGQMGMDGAYGGQPITVNLGASISPDVPYIEKFVLAVDYVDLFNANKVRIYQFNGENDQVLYTDYAESDFMKRLRLGASLGLFDTKLLSATLNAGLYQGGYTAGADLEVLFLKLNVATYQEQLGTGSVDILDRRYMAKIAIGW